MNALGRHILVELIGCDQEPLNDVATIERAMLEAAVRAGATVINSTFHHFSPYGVSGVVVIQESHLAIHTWPEYRYAAVDLFTCGDTVDPWISFDHLKQALGAQNQSAIEMHRGSLCLLERVELDLPDSRRRAEQAVMPHLKRNVWFTDRDEDQALALRYTGDVLFREKSPIQTVRVFDTPAYGRMLAIDDMIVCTERDEFHYHEMFVHPAMQVMGAPREVLIIGGGDGGTAREVLRYESVTRVLMVEIDEAVVRASRQLLPSLSVALADPRLELRIDDGVRFVEGLEPASFDLVLIDGPEPVRPSTGLSSSDFLRHCHRVVRPRGLVVVQGGSPMFMEREFVDLNRRLKELFGADQVHTLLFFAPTWPSGMWSFQLGVRGDLHPVRDLDPVCAERFARRHGLRYYHAGMHTAAFTLPAFVRRLLGEEERG